MNPQKRQITPSDFKYLLEYDPDSGKLFWLYRSREYFESFRDFQWWNKTFGGTEALNYTKHNGYKEGTIGSSPYLAHRVIWFLMTETWPNQIDHINGDKSDNRWVNLRNVCQQENGMNQKRSSLSTSGRTGVNYHKPSKRWRAIIKVNGKRIHLGSFRTFSDAVKCREDAEIKYGFHENHGRD